MSKRIKVIIAAAAALLVLIAALVVVLNLPEESEKENSSGSSSETASVETDFYGYLKVFDFEKEQVRDITVQNATGGFTLNYVKEETWALKGAEKFSLNSEAIDTLLESCIEFAATKEIAENPEDLSVYGITDEGISATINYSTGEKLSFQMGSTNSAGYSYVYLKQNNKVYMVEYYWVQPFELKSSAYLDLSVTDAVTTDEDGNEQYPTVKKLSFVGRGLKNPIIIERNPEYVTYTESVENGEDTSNKPSPAQYVFTSPMKVDTSDESYLGLQNAYYGISAKDIYSLSPTAAQLSQCGLSDPYVTIKAESTKGDLIIKLGNTVTVDEQECYYAVSNQREPIFIVDAADFSFFKEDLVTYMSPIVVNVVIDEIDTLTFETEGKKYVFETSGEDDDLVVRLNGKKLSTAEYRDLYQLVMLAYCEESVEPGQYKGDADLKITYTYREREKVDVLEYVKAETRKYLIRLNDSDLALVRSKYVDTLIFGLNEFVAGRDVPSDY